MNSQLVKRIKSLIWRAGGVGAAAFLTEITVGLPDLGAPEIWVAVIGLLIGELTKYLNTGR